MPMDVDSWIYIALFFSFGATCGVIGFLAGATSKVAPYLKAIRSLKGEKDELDPIGVPEHR
jgi:hypothetical protein